MSDWNNDGRGIPQRLRRFLTMVTALVAALHAYIGWRLLPVMGLGELGWSIGVVFLILSTLLMPVGMAARFLFHSPGVSDRMTWIGSLLMGLFSSLLVLTFLRDLALIVLPASLVVGSAKLVPLLALLVTLIGFVNARRIPRVAEVAVPIHGLPEALQGFTIVQISDLHVGATIKRDYVEGVVERLNALHPDLIAVTGDLVDGTVERLAPHIAPLGRMRARHGVFAVRGNHEYYWGAEQWIAEFRRLGMQVLMNEHVIVEHDGARLVVAGVTDYSAGAFAATHRSDPAKALADAPMDGTLKLLLAHQPRSAAEAEKAGFDLQLSGHTHGGQFWPWSLLVPLQQPFTSGLHRLGRLWIYTSRGTGYWGPPKRFGAPSEITLLRLEPKKMPSM